MAQHIVNISGGKDSTATYLKAIERGRPFRAVWSDTGHEHPLTVEYIRTLPSRTGGPEVERVAADFSLEMARKREFIRKNWAKHGVPQDRIDRALEILQPTGIPFLDLCLWKGRFPSNKAQFCTEELKAKPIQEQVIVPALEHGDLVQWLGIRREESKRRAKTPVFRRVRWIEPRRTMIYFAPLADWNWRKVFDMHDRHGIRPNPLYTQGASRVGCWACINAQKAELAMIARIDPSAPAKLKEWEVLVAEASKRGAATFFGPDKTPRGADMMRRGVKGYGDEKYPDALEVFDWSGTSRGGRQYDLITAIGACASEYGLCE
jgi:3'-phosphoadenosine 5'-phosphosulfate sulfotransferase (PAPS reductase)/FAD synthetase